MNNAKISLILLLLIQVWFMIPSTAQAQDRSGETVRVETNDGTILIGRIVEENEDQIILRVDGIGEITIEKTNIRSLRTIEPDRIRDGSYWFDNPHGTRYFFAPNAIGLKQGAGYYQNTWILFNNANVGLTDNISIGAGLVPLFLFGQSSFPFWILPKISIPVTPGKLYLGGGALIGGVVGEDTDGGFGLLYGNTTIGNGDRNLTIGLGYGFGGGEISDTPLVNVSGLIRTNRTFQLLGEIYFLPGIEGSGFGIFGGRWAPENFALDFGLARPLSAVDIIGVPWLSVTIPFGNR